MTKCSFCIPACRLKVLQAASQLRHMATRMSNGLMSRANSVWEDKGQILPDKPFALPFVPYVEEFYVSLLRYQLSLQVGPSEPPCSVFERNNPSETSFPIQDISCCFFIRVSQTTPSSLVRTKPMLSEVREFLCIWYTASASHLYRVLISMLPLSLHPSIFILFFFQDIYSVIWNSDFIHQSTLSSNNSQFFVFCFQNHFCLAIQEINLYLENFSYEIPIGASLLLEKKSQFLWEYSFFFF